MIDLIGSGSGISAAQADSTNTLRPISPANAVVSVLGTLFILDLKSPTDRKAP